MSSLREQILVAIQTKLSTVPNATVFRSRQDAVAREEGNALLLQPEKESPQKRSSAPGGTVLRDFLINVIVMARGDPPDQVADAVIAVAHAQIMSDPTLGNLCAQVIDDSTEWTFQEADLTACEVKIRYIVRYLTTLNSLSS